MKLENETIGTGSAISILLLGMPLYFIMRAKEGFEYIIGRGSVREHAENSSNREDLHYNSK
ncbi:MAG TPA: hypothetical protein VMC07_02325 [Candidatus Omnitrophota bacterium]|nr:hypothetical protein [Candidatus Omnitrophota bacterium]